LIKDSYRTRLYAKITLPVGLLAGFFYAGVGLVPHDLHFATHVFFANSAFLILFFLCILHSITVYHSNFVSNNYVIGYIAFCIVLFIYLYIIFFGPQIGPGKIFSEKELILQVVSQKSIVLTFMAAILHQVYGFNKILTNKE
jgi:magnesium-transporting ATPase (P-type)